MTVAGEPSSAMSASGALCTACGACCNGTLFDEVPLARDEIALGKRLSLPIVACGDEASMALPCPRLDVATCTVYADRPSTCRTFRCGLLEDVEAGVAPLDDALVRVEALRAASGRVRALLPTASRGTPIFRAIDDVAAACGGRRSAEYVEGRADLVAAAADLGEAMRAVTRRRDPLPGRPG